MGIGRPDPRRLVVRRALLDPYQAWEVESGAYHTYQDTWIEANSYFADKASDQFFMVFGGALAAPVVMSAGVGTAGWATTQMQAFSSASLTGAQSLGASGYAGLWSAQNAASLGVYRTGTAVAGAVAPLQFYGGVAANTSLRFVQAAGASGYSGMYAAESFAVNTSLRLSQAAGATSYAGLWRAESFAAQSYWQTNVAANNAFNGVGTLGKVWAGGSFIFGFTDGLSGRYLGFSNPPFSPGSALPGQALIIYNQAHQMGGFIGNVRDADRNLNE